MCVCGGGLQQDTTACTGIYNRLQWAGNTHRPAVAALACAQVRWRADLPPVALSGRRKAQQSTHNLVVASYVLGELPTAQERAALIRHLWGELAGQGRRSWTLSSVLDTLLPVCEWRVCGWLHGRFVIAHV